MSNRLPKAVNAGNAQISQIDSTDPFGYRLNANVSTVFSLMPKPSVTAIRSRTQTTNSASISSNGSETTLSTGTTSSSTATLDTQQWGRYIPGYSGVYGIRVQVPQDITSDQEVKWGAFNDSNGIIHGEDSTGYFVQVRDGGTDSDKIRPANFKKSLPNAFDTSETVIYRNPFTFYGAGTVFFDVFMANNGRDIRRTYHSISPEEKSDIGLTANGSPIFEQPNFPVRAVVDNGTTTSDVKLNVIGRQFHVLGDYSPSRRVVSNTVENLTVSASGTTNVANFQFKSNWRPVEVKFNEIQVINQGTESIELDVLYGTSITSGSFGAFDGISASENPLEVDTSGSESGGEKVEDFLFEASGNNSQSTQTSGVNQVQPISFPKFSAVSVIAKTLTSSSTTVDCNIAFRAEM